MSHLTGAVHTLRSISAKYINLSLTTTDSMEEEYIDVRNSQGLYERGRELFQEDQNISARNKEIVHTFLRDAALGKTIIGRAKRKIGPARLHSYIMHLTCLSHWVQKDLDTLTQADMENFVAGLETDAVRSRAPRTRGSQVVADGAALSARYKADIKMTIRKFYPTFRNWARVASGFCLATTHGVSRG